MSVLRVVDGCIPSDMATGSAAEIEEERRLLYVAMTRARHHLHLLVPQRFYVSQQSAFGDRHVYGSISRFLPQSLHGLVRARRSEPRQRRASEPMRRRPQAPTSARACARSGPEPGLHMQPRRESGSAGRPTLPPLGPPSFRRRPDLERLKRLARQALSTAFLTFSFASP